EEARLKLNAIVRASSDAAGIVQRLNSIVDDPGYPRHGVVVAAYILLKYGGLPSVTALSAARSAAAQDSKNSFFEYVANGANDTMLKLIHDGCRASGDPNLHPRYQWIWERADDDKTNPKNELMYWDCLFTAKLYFAGSLPGSNLPALPGLEVLYLAETRAFAALQAEAVQLVEMIKNFKDHPEQSLAYVAHFPVASGQAMTRGAV